MIAQTAERTVPLATALGQMIRVGYLVDCTDSVGRELEEVMLAWSRGSHRGAEIVVGLRFDDYGRQIRLTEGDELRITLKRQSGFNYQLTLEHQGVVLGSKFDSYVALCSLQFQWQVCRLIQYILGGAA